MAEKEKDGRGKESPERRRRIAWDKGAAAPAATGEESGDSRDPLVVLGPDLLTKVLEILDALSVARSVVVSRKWNDVSASDYLWAPKCKELWKEKAHIPRLSEVRGASKLASYSMAVMDGKRARITKEDLCDHAWEFRFKKMAGEYWLNLDHSWMGTGPPMHRYFHPNGSHTADPGDRVWGGHECMFSVVTSFVGEKGRIRDHYVRINRCPPLTVSRKGDWSWEMSNGICCYNSIPDADEKSTGPLFPVW